VRYAEATGHPRTARRHAAKDYGMRSVRKIINYHGQPLEVDVITPAAQREPFKAKFVQVPLWWVEALRQTKRVSTYQLAHAILTEAFKRERLGGDIVLSSKVTGMLRNARMKATKELVEFGLIEVERSGMQAARVRRRVLALAHELNIGL
jgi:hypothetical protein